MHYVVQRFGLRPTRGWLILFVIGAILVGAAFWIGPFRARPAELQLLALSGDGRFREYVGIPTRWADTLSPGSEATARIPLVLAVHNAGARVARPQQLSLSLPARFRIANHDGPLEARMSMGNPLARYDVNISPGAIQPGAAPTMLRGADTLWIEPVIPTLYCTALADSVPEFIAAPPHDAQANARIRIFYSFEGRELRYRQTGLLTVQVDPKLVTRPPAPAPPIFETVITKPAPPLPDLGALRFAGSRTSACGDPSYPVDLHTALWETMDGGRFFVVYHGGAPRKHLYDLNRDSIIELELWDSDGDGEFEARRAARFTIPGFIMPLPTREDSAVAALAAADTMPIDSAWLSVFHDTMTGPLRFGPRRAAAPPPAASDTTATVTTPPAAPPTARPGAPIVAEPVDSAALDIFNAADAGPLRFERALRGDTVRPPPPPPARPAPRREQGPPLLGEPYRPGR